MILGSLNKLARIIRTVYAFMFLNSVPFWQTGVFSFGNRQISEPGFSEIRAKILPSLSLRRT